MELHILPPQFSGDPEALAMLQAFYSRSAESIVSRVERLGTDLTSVKAALNKFYIGYGHQSIGDCGTVKSVMDWLERKEACQDPLCAVTVISASSDAGRR
jgi:hypothetical protein